ncbi:MAG: NfeD family protein [bacterium]|nr:NfeD family protein [bacterium]
MTSALLWLIVAVIFFIVEILTPIFLFSLFSMAAFLVSIFAFFFPKLYYVQGILFAAFSFVLILFVRKIFLKYFMKDDKNGAKSNADSMAGRKCRIVETVDNAKDSGVALIDGVRWRALSDGDEIITEGSSAEIVSVNGAKLKVKKSNG